MSVGKQKSLRSYDYQPNTRRRPPKVQAQVEAPLVEQPRRGITRAEKEISKRNSSKPPKRPVINPKPSLQVSKSPLPVIQVEEEVIPSSQPDNQIPIESYDEEPEDPEVFKQAPNPPLPEYACCRYPSAEGISGKAAAIAYLRIRGLANRGRKKTFYTLLAWILCHAARQLGFEIVPDGFVRISDLVGIHF